MYKEYGWTDTGVDSTSFIYPKLRAALSKDKNKCILDLGCGNGEIARKLIAEGFCVYGVDGSSEGVEIANSHNPNRFFVMNFEKEELPEELGAIDFDTIISTEVIEHLYDPDAYIKLCGKILKKGGNIFLTTPYHGYIKNLALSITGKWDNHFTVLWLGGHIKFWSRTTLTQLLNQNGFTVKKFVGCGRIAYLWKSMLMEAVIEPNEQGELHT